MRFDGQRIVIGGMPRCGTTLLATLISSQDACWFSPEYLDAFPLAADRLSVRWNQPLARPQRRVALAMVRGELLSRLGHPLLVRDADFSTLDELHAAMLGDLAQPGHRVAGHNAFFKPSQIAAALIEAGFSIVVMVRDPRDAALSYWQRFGTGVDGYLEYWKSMTRILKQHRHHPRLIPVRFEDLVAEPERTLARLAGRLDVPLHLPAQGLTYPGRRGNALAWNDNSAFEDVREPFDERPVGRWHLRQRSPIVQYAAWRCERELLVWGYEPIPQPGIGLANRLRFGQRTLIKKAARGLSNAISGIANQLAPPIEGG